MSLRQTLLSDLPDVTVTEPLVLAIGVPADEVTLFHTRLMDSRVEYLPLMLLHAALAKAPWAETIVTPLLTEQFDAMDMAAELALADYCGTYAVILPPVPRPEIIKKELNAICPKVRIELWTRTHH